MSFIKMNKHDSQTPRTKSKPEDRSGGQQVSSRIWHTDRGNGPNGGQGSRQKLEAGGYSCGGTIDNLAGPLGGNGLLFILRG